MKKSTIAAAGLFAYACVASSDITAAPASQDGIESICHIKRVARFQGLEKDASGQEIARFVKFPRQMAGKNPSRADVVFLSKENLAGIFAQVQNGDICAKNLSDPNVEAQTQEIKRALDRFSCSSLGQPDCKNG